MKFTVELRTNKGDISFNTTAENPETAAAFVNQQLNDRPARFKGKNGYIEIKENVEIFFIQIIGDPARNKQLAEGQQARQEVLGDNIKPSRADYKETFNGRFLGQDLTIEAQAYVNDTGNKEKYYYVPMRVNDQPAYDVLDRQNLAEVLDQILSKHGPKNYKILIPPAIIPDWEEAVEYIKDYIKEEEKAELRQDKTAVAYWGWKKKPEE